MDYLLKDFVAFLSFKIPHSIKIDHRELIEGRAVARKILEVFAGETASVEPAERLFHD